MITKCFSVLILDFWTNDRGEYSTRASYRSTEPTIAHNGYLLLFNELWFAHPLTIGVDNKTYLSWFRREVYFLSMEAGPGFDPSFRGYKSLVLP